MSIFTLNIVTSFDYPPIPDRNFDWSAHDSETYDGAEDSSNRNQVGYGRTEQQALADWLDISTETDDAFPVFFLQAVNARLTEFGEPLLVGKEVPEALSELERAIDCVARRLCELRGDAESKA